MKYRKLRIAWSVAWGIVAVLLIGLCVRSYWQIDKFSWQRGTTRLAIDSFNGRIGTTWCFYTQAAFNQPKLPAWSSLDARSGVRSNDDEMGEPKQYLFGIEAYGAAFPSVKVFYISIGDWFPMAWCALAIATPWMLPKRFNLLNLLIATTLVAVVLGLIVWLTR